MRACNKVVGMSLRPEVMRAVRPVDFGDVVRAWSAARDPGLGSGPWTLRMLQAADRQFGGQWLDLQVRADALLGVVLPRHAGEPCHGDRRELVPAGGLTVDAAAEGLRAWDEAARAESRECWRRLDYATTEPFSRVILATGPLKDHPDYVDLPPGPGMFHLDGFHRLLGWALARRLSNDAWVDVHLARPASSPGLAADQG